ncbi:MAG: tandem-95 repeat protein, partial [Desulfobacteraceae bacterium]|nr:tandem-95 repeat protein [Desulfobacteraceae bacterium]
MFPPTQRREEKSLSKIKEMPSKVREVVSNQSCNSLMLALEPRILFDAAGLMAGLDLLPGPEAIGPDFDSAIDITDQEPVPDLLSGLAAYTDSGPPAGDTSSAIIFIDSGVTDYENLVSDISGDTRVVILDPQADGITQIRDVLNQYQNIEAVHIISHGTQAGITLGDAVLSNDTIDDYAATLQDWGTGLSQGADILIYGCNVAKGTDGQAFVAQLSDITGADVAASDDVTGADNSGGDWDLENRTGIIESDLAVSEQARQSYAGTLANIVVDSADDNTTGGDGYTTLREAIYEAENTYAGADTITFDAALAGKTITLQHGELKITGTDAVTIDGDINGDDVYDITVDGDDTYRVFNAGSNTSVTLDALCVTNGYTTGEGGGIYNAGTLTVQNSTISNNKVGIDGGGIYNDGTLTVKNTSISGNTADSEGGGINNQRYLNIYNSTISNNEALGGPGGGIYVGFNLKIYDSTISNNYSAVMGGGIFNTYFMEIHNSTISYNDAKWYGGGICNSYNYYTSMIYGSTISGNSANNQGGGIYSRDALNLYHSTIANNTASSGAGINNKDTITIGHTIVTGSIAGSSITSKGYNLFEQGSVSGAGGNDFTGATADLDPLADNGGPTLTHALGNDSDAFEVGDNSAATITAYDQRGSGYARVLDTIDIGALEMTRRPPTGVNDSFSTDEDTAFTTGDVLTNDSDLDGNALTLTGFDVTGTKGSVTDNGDDTFDYDPDGQFESLSVGDSATDTFTYTISDGTGFTDTVTVEITITGANESPTANDDSDSTDEDTTITVSVLTNDTDPDTSDILSVQSIDTTGTKGDVTDNGDGTLGYDPNGQFDALSVGETGTDTFTYTISDGNGGTDSATVTITVTGVNEDPTANDDGDSTDEDTSVTTGNVLLNDTDPDTSDTPSVASIDTTGTKGSVTDNTDGTFDYDPNGQFEYLADGENTTDTFTYTVSDGNGGTDSATVTITITGVNDAPIANDDNDTTGSGAVLTVSPLTNDTDPDTTDTYSVDSIDTTGTKGSVTDNGDGTLDYDPNGQFNYLESGQSATDTFTYTVSDGNGGTDTATITITVTGGNDDPTAIDDNFSTDANTAFTTGDVLLNDTDADPSDTLSVDSIDTSGTKGTVTSNGDGTFDYNPNGRFDYLSGSQNSTDTFTYTVSDGNGGTDTATVTISIIGVNNNPEANNDNYDTDADTAFTFGSVLANDTDPDTSDTLVVESFYTSGAKG